MNLIDAKVVDTQAAIAALDDLQRRIYDTLAGQRLTAGRVISACDALSHKIDEARHLPLLLAMGMPKEQAHQKLEQARAMLGREALALRVRTELGESAFEPCTLNPPDADAPVVQQWRPLGVLLHIAAGNADALPAFSAIEGLLCGNINLLKLPGGENGLSVLLLQQLVQIDPLLARYLYVFDFPSTDTALMQRLANAADAVVTWGGDEAVNAVRRLAHPSIQLVEWGNRLGCAYVTPQGATDDALAALADNICQTDQLLCSSCQGVYLDTADMAAADALAKRLLEILDHTARLHPRTLAPGVQARVTLERWCARLEAAHRPHRVYQTALCGVSVYPDSALEPSIQFRNCWVRPLPRKNIIPALRPYKNRLQTVALACAQGERRELTDALLQTGAVRVSDARNMSRAYTGMPHDGAFALTRYMKRVSIEA